MWMVNLPGFWVGREVWLGCALLHWVTGKAGSRVARMPTLPPHQQAVGEPRLSDDETVAKMWYPVLWPIEMWATRPDDSSRERELRTPGLR